MKYAQVKNGKVVATQQGIEPTGWVEVQVKWEMPTDYPSNFYSPTSNIPRLTVVGNEVHETWGFTLKSVDSIKVEIYEQQRQARKTFEAVPIDYLGKKIDVSTEAKRSRIMTLKGKDKKLKVGVNDWLDLSTQEVKDLQDLVDDTTQTGFDAENAANTTVAALTTHQQLADYLQPAE